jgi:hypothetical protein
VEWLEEAQQCAVSECDLLLADIHTVQVRFSSREYGKGVFYKVNGYW